MKPVYIINGFLESGKTEFISYTLSQPYFQTRGTTLLILCEEGEIEYDEDILKNSRTIVEVVDEEAQMTSANLIELEKKHKPERIIIEYNGMWNFKNLKLPWHWRTEQQITTIDAFTFLLKPLSWSTSPSQRLKMMSSDFLIISASSERIFV